MNDIYWKRRTMTVAFQRMFGILERWNNNQVTPSLSKPHELSYRSNICESASRSVALEFMRFKGRRLKPWARKRTKIKEIKLYSGLALCNHMENDLLYLVLLIKFCGHLFCSSDYSFEAFLMSDAACFHAIFARLGYILDTSWRNFDGLLLRTAYCTYKEYMHISNIELSSKDLSGYLHKILWKLHDWGKMLYNSYILSMECLIL